MVIDGHETVAFDGGALLFGAAEAEKGGVLLHIAALSVVPGVTNAGTMLGPGAVALRV